MKSAGFDEYMNVVIDEAEEINMKSLNRHKLGRILLKVCHSFTAQKYKSNTFQGDNITLIQTIQ